MLPTNISVSFWNACSETFVVVGILDRVDDHVLDLAQIQPLRGEIIHQRFVGARIGQHAAHFFFQSLRIAQLFVFRQGQQAIVWDAAPQKEGQPRG